MENFTDFAVIAGGAAAALIGLLFVAVSIRADLIGRSVELRSRIAQILALFLAVLASWLLVTLPNPGELALGVELIVVALLAGTALAVLDARAKRSNERQVLASVLDRLNPNVITAVLIGLSGLVLVFGQSSGLFLLALATIVGFVGGVVGAWLVLVRVDD